MKMHCFETPLGAMLAIADEKTLYLLEFKQRRGLRTKIEKLKKQTKITPVEGVTAPIRSIQSEIKAYFAGTLKKFETPIHLYGTPFQQIVWKELLRIPYSETRSYAEQAKAIGKKTAYRAVANANGANQLAIIIPCHRIINSDGQLGGYGGGIERKQWLLEHEQQHG